jgi:hypothetical protein
MLAKLSFVPALAAALLVPLVAHAQDRDDSELARVLAQRGWFDLAEEICDKLDKGSARALVPYIRADIQLGKVERETEFPKAVEGLTAATGFLKKFLDENPSHPMALEAQTSIGWVQARKGRLAIDALEIESDASKHSDLQKMAIQAYADAGKYYEDTIAKLRKEKQTDRVLDALMDARLELPRVMIDHAKVTGVDDVAKKRLLDPGQRLLVDFEFDYGDRPIAFEAMLEGGKCLTELGDYKQASPSSGDVRAPEAARRGEDQAERVPQQDHLRRLHRARPDAPEGGQADEAKNFIDQVLKEDRTLDKEWAGLR